MVHGSTIRPLCGDGGAGVDVRNDVVFHGGIVVMTPSSIDMAISCCASVASSPITDVAYVSNRLRSRCLRRKKRTAASSRQQMMRVALAKETGRIRLSWESSVSGVFFWSGSEITEGGSTDGSGTNRGGTEGGGGMGGGNDGSGWLGGSSDGSGLLGGGEDGGGALGGGGGTCGLPSGTAGGKRGGGGDGGGGNGDGSSGNGGDEGGGVNGDGGDSGDKGGGTDSGGGTSGGGEGGGGEGGGRGGDAGDGSNGGGGGRSGSSEQREVSLTMRMCKKKASLTPSFSEATVALGSRASSRSSIAKAAALPLVQM